MKKIFYIVPLIITLYNPGELLAQNEVIDSLEYVLKSTKEDTNKVNILCQISELCDEGDILKYAMPALKLAEKLNFKKGIANASGNIGYVYQNLKADDKRALEYYNRSLQLRKEMNDRHGIAESLNNIGAVYKNRGNAYLALSYYKSSMYFNQAIGNSEGLLQAYNNIGEILIDMGDITGGLEYLNKTLIVMDKVNDKSGEAMLLNNLAVVYQDQNYLNKANEYLLKSLKIQEELNNKRAAAYTLNNIGLNYSHIRNLPLALEYHLKSLKIRQETGDRRGIALSLSNIGAVYGNLGNLTKELACYKESLKIWEQINDPKNISLALVFIATSYLRKKAFSQAEKFGSQSLQIANKIGFPESILRASSLLARIYAEEKKYKEAYEMQILFKQMSDSINNINTKEAVVKKQMQYEFSKTSALLKSEQDKKDAITNIEIKKQKVVRNFSLTGVFSVLFFGGYIFYNFRKRKKLESKQALSNERLRISRELHDDIGSTLGSIAVYSDVAKNRSVKNENPVDVLSKIGTASRELIEKMSDIVWSLNPDNETFEQLQNRMQGFAAMILTPRNITIEFKTNDELKTLQITSEQRKNIFLIYKEAVHNIVKYAECKNVFISLTKSNSNLSLVIKDDGKGFDADNAVVYNGNGLKNMKARADDIKATLNIISKVNGGATIKVSIKI